MLDNLLDRRAERIKHGRHRTDREALLGLGGTTPVASIALGRAFNVLTFERFTFWATLMALPIVGLVAAEFIERSGRKAVTTLWILAVATSSFAENGQHHIRIDHAPYAHIED